MQHYKRYAVYFCPEPSPLAEFGVRWFGWDAAKGQQSTPSILGDLRLEDQIENIIEAPRKYGLHGTIKAPFRLANGTHVEALHDALSELTQALPTVMFDALYLEPVALESGADFLALQPLGDVSALNRIADRIVCRLDKFRAPLTREEIARRNPDVLSAKQYALLQRWGYPYVMEEFRFHITLTGSVKPELMQQLRIWLKEELADILPKPFSISSLCLMGEQDDGYFRLLHRYPLSGTSFWLAPLSERFLD